MGLRVSRRHWEAKRPVVMMIYPMVTNFVIMGCALPLVYKPMPIEHLGLLAVIALFAWVASFLVILAYRAGEAAIIAPMQYSQIIWATMFGMLFFDETPDVYTGVGASIIIASGLYIVLRESRGTSKNTPVLRNRSRSVSGAAPRISLFMRALGQTPPRKGDAKK